MTPFQRKIKSLTRSKYLPFSLGELPLRLDQETLENLVVKLRNGDESVINKIAEGHLRLGVAIAARYGSKYRSKIDDLIGVMQLELVESVKKAKTKLHDNNITPYISVCIHAAIWKFIEEDHVMFIPGRTFRYFIEKGDQRVDKPPVQVAMFENSLSIDESEVIDLGANELRDKFYVIPQVNDDNIKLLEIQELLDKSTHDFIEKRVIELRAEGYTYEEIVPNVGYAKSKIQVIVKTVEERFYKIYKA